jgi:ABC-2 type transport system ATP-binding protein
MIEVEHLNKRYGDFTALSDVSFQVGRGEVVGFLGPNGAGKSTTMRILCGCIGASSGHARIAGHDVLNAPNEVKRKVGFLPEVPPLYPSMTVEDYVSFAASLKGVANPSAATDKTLGRVGLSDVRGRVISQLSKGYRQRVGLAQALVHDPEVLVLDEPTSGLDPAQRREIRDLLTELAAGERTVILSTHVLAEIEAVCERVVIINHGRVVTTDSIAALAASNHRVRLRVARPDDAFLPALHAVEGVGTIQGDADGTWLVSASHDVRERIAAAAVPFGLLELGAGQNLEDIYLQLTSEGQS